MSRRDIVFFVQPLEGRRLLNGTGECWALIEDGQHSDQTVDALLEDQDNASDPTPVVQTTSSVQQETSEILPVFSVTPVFNAGTNGGIDERGPAFGGLGGFVVTTEFPVETDTPFTYEMSGVAINGVDYEFLSGAGVMPAGSQIAYIDVLPINDEILERGESVNFTLHPGAGYTIGWSSYAENYILDDDAATIYASSASMMAGDPPTEVYVGVRDDEWPQPPEQGITLTVDSLTGPFSATWKNGNNITDANGEAILLVQASGAGQGQYRIRDHRGNVSSEWDGTLYADPPPAASIAPSAYASEGSGSIDFSVTLDRAPNAVATINAFVTDGRAIGGQDYVVPAPQITFQPGQTWATFSVVPMADSNREWTEDFVVTLAEDGSGTSRVDPNWSTGIGEIVDDDAVSITVPEVIRVNNDDDNGNNTQDMEESGSVSGEDDLVPVTLAVPTDDRPGATVTLASSGDPVKVWKDVNKSQLILDPVNPSYTWTLGGSMTVPTTLYAEGIAGSAVVGGIVLTLSATDAGATPDAPANPTATQGEDKGTGLQISIRGGPFAQDVTGKSRDWLVGQVSEMYVDVQPAAWGENATYQWTVPGDVLYDYRIAVDSSSAVAISLGEDHVVITGSANETTHYGTAQKSIRHFWVSTTAVAPNPDTNSVQVQVGNVNGQSFNAATTFTVFEPIVSNATIIIGTAGFSPDNTHIGLFGLGRDSRVGMIVDATVEMPVPFQHQTGEWAYVQKANVQSQYQKDDGSLWRNQHYGEWVLDNSFPYPAGIGDPDWDGDSWPTGPSSHVTGDTPMLEVRTTETMVEISDGFATFIIFRPPGTDTRWVPLQKAGWNFFVRAIKQDGVHVLDPANPPTQSKSPFAATTEVPVWDHVFSNDSSFEQVP